MKKNPILVFTGLAVAAVAAIAGLTKDQWMSGAPQQIASSEVAKTADVAAPATTAPATPEQTTAATAEAPAQQAAAEAVPAETTPATPPAAPAQPAAEQTAATAEAPAPASVTAAVPAAETPAAPAADTPAAESMAAPAAKEEVPAFDTVRVEKTGEALIAGTAKAGSEVVVKLDGLEIGKAVANSDGAFVVVPEAPLPSGSGALTIEAKGKGDLSVTASDQSVAVMVPASQQEDALVAVMSPNAPTKVLQKPAAEATPDMQVATVEPAAPEAAAPEAAAPEAAAPEAAAPEAAATEAAAPEVTAPQAVAPEAAAPEAAAPAVEAAAPKAAAAAAAAAKAVSIDAVDYDPTGNIVFSGQGEPGHGARVYVDNKHAGDASIGDDGRWSFAGTADVSKGVHALRVDGIDGSGKVVNRVEVPFFREESQKVAAAVPANQVVAKTEPAAAAPAAASSEAATEVAATAPAAEAPSAAAPKDGRVVIQPGNNLWRISRVLYGSGVKYTTLYEANKDQIRDPDMIYPGQIFMTPDVVSKQEIIDPKRRDPLTPEENAASAQ